MATRERESIFGELGSLKKSSGHGRSGRQGPAACDHKWYSKYLSVLNRFDPPVAMHLRAVVTAEAKEAAVSYIFCAALGRRG
jgi:hypothetical protein